MTTQTNTDNDNQDSPEIVFDNVVKDEEINYRTLIIRGHIEKVDSYEDFIFVCFNDVVYPWPIEDGHFRGVVELRKRHNNIYFQYGSINHILHLHYIPLNDVPTVKVVLFYCKDTQYQIPLSNLIDSEEIKDPMLAKKVIKNKISTAVSLIQSAIGDINFIHRGNRQTFSLEQNTAFQMEPDYVNIHFVQLNHSSNEIHHLCEMHKQNDQMGEGPFKPFIDALETRGHPFDSTQYVMGFFLDSTTDQHSGELLGEFNSILMTPNLKMSIFSCAMMFSWPTDYKLYEYLSKISYHQFQMKDDFGYSTDSLVDLWNYSLTRFYLLILSLLNLKSKEELNEGVNEDDFILKAFLQDQTTHVLGEPFNHSKYFGSLMFPKHKSLEFHYHPTVRPYEFYLDPINHLTSTSSIYICTNGLLIQSSSKIVSVRVSSANQEHLHLCHHSPMKHFLINSNMWKSHKSDIATKLTLHLMTGGSITIPDVKHFILTNLTEFHSSDYFYQSPTPFPSDSGELTAHFNITFYKQRVNEYSITLFGNQHTLSGIQFTFGESVSKYGKCDNQLGFPVVCNSHSYLASMHIYLGTTAICGLELFSNQGQATLFGNKQGRLVLVEPPEHLLIYGIHGAHSTHGLVNLGIIHKAKNFETHHTLSIE